MPLFSRFKNKGSQPASKVKQAPEIPNGKPPTPQKPKWVTTWSSETLVPEEVQELVHACTAEMKSRAEALDSPFLLLPFRPDSDAGGARTFIRSYYKANAEGSSQYRGAGLQQELRLTEPVVLCSIIKWCWSRMPGGVVTWPVYEGFQIGEKESKMARHAFDTFIPIGAGSEARKSIIFDFFDLLSAVAAHGKMNGLGGRKLSRLAGWWAFAHADHDKGFEGGYESWAKAADAASHLFFAYLRSLSPEADPSMSVIERIPRSLQALLGSTEYPPETPTLLQRSTPRVVMLVDSVSPGPFALLRRAKHFEYRDRDSVLREFSEFEDPVDALTDECKRVLYEISTINSSQPLSRQGEPKTGQESWSAFQNLGFSDLDERVMSPKSPDSLNGSAGASNQGLRSQPRSRNVDHARPTTPSWADFLSSGFADDDADKAPTTLSLPSDKMLPPISSRAQTPHTITSDDNLAPGELAAVTNVDLDDAFWWVWMTSLASEEPSNRKAVFGRCALIETSIMNGRWLIMEEQVKGASPDPVEAYEFVPQKKSIFGFTKRGKNKRTKSERPAPEPQPQLERVKSDTPSKSSLAPDQHSKIKAAAAALAHEGPSDEAEPNARRGRIDDTASTKTSSMLTLGMMSEASPAMKWANAYDKNNIRAQYLGSSFAGRGLGPEDRFRTSSINLPGDRTSSVAPDISEPAAEKPRDQAVPPPPEAEQATGGAAPSEAAAHAPAAGPETKVPTGMPSSPPAINIQQDDTEDQREVDDASSVEVKQAEPASSKGKETGIDLPQRKQSKVERKPVPRPNNLQDHPAFRQEVPEETAAKAAATSAPTAPVETQTHQAPEDPAAVAAQRAMEVQKLRKQGGGGFKKLFGRNKKETHEKPPVESTQQSDQQNNKGLTPPSETNLGRRLSLLRRKSTRPSTNASQVAVAQPAPENVPDPVSPVSPLSPESSERAEQSHDYVSRVNTRTDADAKDEFSRFDQGPMEDMPASEPVSPPEYKPTDTEYQPADESVSPMEEMPAPTPKHPDNTNVASRIDPERQESDNGAFETPMERPDPVEDTQSEATMEEPQRVEPEKDRWAQIRENAAKRAARASEEQSVQSRPSHQQSMRETDDGETSGEETIESRVARIKARVAELTGGAGEKGAPANP
ncbi:hypothetical protein NU195Hw_g4661t1 [Hortaea werneckii]